MFPLHRRLGHSLNASVDKKKSAAGLGRRKRSLNPIVGEEGRIHFTGNLFDHFYWFSTHCTCPPSPWLTLCPESVKCKASVAWLPVASLPPTLSHSVGLLRQFGDCNRTFRIQFQLHLSTLSTCRSCLPQWIGWILLFPFPYMLPDRIYSFKMRWHLMILARSWPITHTHTHKPQSLSGTHPFIIIVH